MVLNRSMVRRWAERLAWILVALVLVLGGAILGISAYAASSMTRCDRVAVEVSPADYSLEYTDVAFPSRDGLALRGWWLEGGASETVVMVHGSDRHRADPTIGMLDVARELVGRGYNVLLFDLRGHGDSEGERVSAGYYERNDLLGAIDFLREGGNERIAVLGFSMGGAAALMAAAECELAGVVADSVYANLTDIMDAEFSRRSPLPRFFLPVILYMAKSMYHIDFAAVQPAAAVRDNVDCPLFIIHGGRDDTVPVAHAQSLFEAAPSPGSELWLVSEAEHVGAYVSRPDEYINRVASFLDRVFG